MSEIKKVPKRLRSGKTVMVDVQILRRRKMLAEKGIVLGKASRRLKKHNDAAKEERAKPAPTKRKWF